MTPQGLVKVMNHYLSTMSGPIRSHRGIIDKYIGDAIMAYWGPPFTEDGEQARLACLAAVDMADRGTALRTELPELLGVRTDPERLRRPHRHRDRRGAGRQHRLGIHDELHRDGRRGEPGLAPGGRQQVLRQPFAGFGSQRSWRPAMRSSCARSTGWWSSARPMPKRCSRSSGAQGELDREATELRRGTPKGSLPIGRAAGMMRAGLSGGARGRPRRRAVHGDGSTRRELSGQSAGRRLGWRVAPRSEVTRRGAFTPAENPAPRRKIPAAPVRTSSGGCPG